MIIMYNYGSVEHDLLAMETIVSGTPLCQVYGLFMFVVTCVLYAMFVTNSQLKRSLREIITPPKTNMSPEK